MYTEADQHIHYYNRINQQLYLTEFGHTRVQKQRRVGPYVRSVWLLHVVLQDCCRFCSWEIAPGEGFLIAKGQTHTLLVEPGYEHFWFGFDGAGVPALAALFPMELSDHQHLRFSLPVSELRQRCYACHEEAAGTEGERRAFALLMSLLACLQQTQGKPASAEYVQNACAYMKHNYYRHMTMEEVARSVGVSEKHLCRLFKEETGLTPVRYLIRLRMQQARTLLQKSDLRIKDVALAVGYPSQLTFSSAFSAFYGKTPSQIRMSEKAELTLTDEQALAAIQTDREAARVTSQVNRV